MSIARSTSRRTHPETGAPHMPLEGLQDDASRVEGRRGRHSINDVAELEIVLSEPSDELIQSLSQLDGDVMVLGAGGKMGPSLARMARRASDAAGTSRRIIAVSRFSGRSEYAKLQSWGIDALRGDLLDAAFVRSLPEVKNVLYLVGMKFGSESALAEIWTTNAYLPGIIANRFSESRIVALSTGNVYGLTPVDSSNGSMEKDLPEPAGEYAMSTLGRERVFQYLSEVRRTAMTIVRLSYATELRYGVLVDLARKVYLREPISLEMGYLNAIWQPDACEMILRSFACVSTPPTILNVTGGERLSSRAVCERFGELFGRSVRFNGAEAPTALLSDASQAIRLFGAPRTSLERVMALTADWIQRDGETWNKPTLFQVRDGKY